ncbi:MAG: hypothetical protein WDN69_27120 [Aliidongia sp.]
MNAEKKIGTGRLRHLLAGLLATLFLPVAAFAQEPTVVTTTGTFTAVPSLFEPGLVNVF